MTFLGIFLRGVPFLLLSHSLRLSRDTMSSLQLCVISFILLCVLCATLTYESEYIYFIIVICFSDCFWVSNICKCIKFPIRKQFLILQEVCASCCSYLMDCSCEFICCLGITTKALINFQKNKVWTRIPKLSYIATMLSLYNSNPSLEMYCEIINDCLQNA